MVCIMAGGDLLCSNTAQQGCDTVQQCPATRAAAGATRRAMRAAGIESRYNFLYRDRGAKAAALRHGSVCARHDMRHNQCALRHGP